MNKAKKYKLKLDYTADELKELRIIDKACDSPMNAIYLIVQTETDEDTFRNLRRKYRILENHKDFDFMADINNVVMGTAIFPEKKYVVHDKVTDQYIYYNVTEWSLRWGLLGLDTGIPGEKTKEEWLAINPAYEPMLESIEDYEQNKNNRSFQLD